MKKLALTVAVLLLCALSAQAADYYTEVDKTNQIVTVFTIEDGDIGQIVRQMICSTGDDTPDGYYLMPVNQKNTDRGEWYYTLKTYVKWPTRILGGYLFHSVPYHSKDDNDVDEEAVALLGTPASHGCVRLYAEDAKWISETLEAGDIVEFRETDEDRKALTEKLRGGSYTGETEYAEFLGDLVYTAPTDVAETLADIAGRVYGVINITNNEFLNIRSKKDFKSDLAGYVPVGAVVEVLKIEGKWTRIAYREYEGWISTAYVDRFEG